MNRFKFQGTNTSVTVKRGKIEEEETDIIVNWCGLDLKSGPASFLQIHKKAGPAIFSSSLVYEDIVKETDCFITIPGLLNCKLVIHSVMPSYRDMFLRSFMNIAETIKTYKEGNVCRTLSLYIPTEADLCLVGIKTFLLDIGLEEVFVLYKTDTEFEKINGFFEQHKIKETLWKRLDTKVIRTMEKLGTVERQTISDWLKAIPILFMSKLQRMMKLSWNKSKRVQKFSQQREMEKSAMLSE